MGSSPCGRLSGRRERVSSSANGWERLGMDVDGIRSFCGIRGERYVSGLFRKFLRRPALRVEGSLAAHGVLLYEAELPELVSPELPVRVRHFSMRGGLAI